MKPITVRPRKFRAEFEELDGGKARLRYEEELLDEQLAEHTYKLFQSEAEGLRAGHDGKWLWYEFEGDRKHVGNALAYEIMMQFVGDARDALRLINDISENALTGVFAISSDEVGKRANEPLEIEKIPEELLGKSIGGLIEESEKEGIQASFAGDVGLRNLRLMIEMGVVGKDDPLKEAVPKIYEWRKAKFGGVK